MCLNYIIKLLLIVIVSGIESLVPVDFRVVRPETIDTFKRSRKDVTSSFYYEENVPLSVKLGNWIVDFQPSGDDGSLNFHPEFGVSLVRDNKDFDVLVDAERLDALCRYARGSVRGLEGNSMVAITICGTSMSGYVKVGDEVYFLEPLEDEQDDRHVIYKGSNIRSKRSSSNESINYVYKRWEYFNLTGDVIDIDMDDEDRSNDSIHNRWDEDLYRTEENITLINLDTRIINEDNGENLGYFVDTAWETRIITRNNGKINTTSPPMWLEVALVVDHTVIGFHGKDRVQQYVLSLMNIVNAIYQDPTLDANIQLVITRMFLFEETKTSVIRLGDAVKSLQSVNLWNRRLHASLKPSDPKHDVAIWLTRADIGGPSGYAPVSGACDPKRSCTLNRDEGLTSAFIIAHELAHILGLSHDGAQKDSNTCGGDTYYGSIMAPMVSSTFHKFMWSDCSKKEFHEKAKDFTCLLNRPVPTGHEIALNSSLQFTFTMDEQCRVEFGDGYSLCRSFDVIEVCSHLWCAKDDSPLFCRTKRAPPLEGTDCGFDKWCLSGYCETIDRKRFGRNPLHHNPQNGRWSSWSHWGSCSRSCGVGVEFRSRRCDNPPPMHGGNNCFGLPEEWRLCNQGHCLEPIQDLRTQQCSNLPKYLNLENSAKSNMTWLPFESDEHTSKCKLICISKETRELYITDENLIDGTLCSYESSTEICIQGTCHHVGCDGKLFSNTRPDSCGVCGGNNTDCKNINISIQRKLKRELQRIIVIPRLARALKLEANVTMSDLIDPSVAFMLKDRSKQSYSVTIPNSGAHGEIVAGTKFHYKKYSNRHIISANGPLLSEIIVFIFAPNSLIERGIKLSLKTDYFVHKDYLNKPLRYVWILGGWGPCSKSCGSGFRQKTTACFDAQNGRIVPRKECSLLTKPHLPAEKCNTYSCNFHWITGDWEPCSKTCGSHGIQNRELYCLPQTVINDSKTVENPISFPWKSMVSPTKCGENPPPNTRYCNRVSCPSFWEYGNWSECSASCGSGISIKQPHCPAPGEELFYSCGPVPPQERRICRGPYNVGNNSLCKDQRKKFTCKKDQSIYCALMQLQKYCGMRFFRRYCCKSCRKYRMTKIIS